MSRLQDAARDAEGYVMAAADMYRKHGQNLSEARAMDALNNLRAALAAEQQQPTREELVEALRGAAQTMTARQRHEWTMKARALLARMDGGK